MLKQKIVGLESRSLALLLLWGAAFYGDRVANLPFNKYTQKCQFLGGCVNPSGNQLHFSVHPRVLQTDAEVSLHSEARPLGE